MLIKIGALCLSFCWLSNCFAVPADLPKQAVRTVSSGDMLHWSVGLLIVLGIFFFCVWGLRKLSGVAVSCDTEKMRVVGGLSLGIREKVVLLQVGKKQLILGVTPGRIDTLHVLEGDDCLQNQTLPLNNGFAQHLIQAIKGRTDA